MKQKTILIIASSIVILSFLGIIVVMGLMIKENNQCLNNPLVYGAQRLEEAGGVYTCSCYPLTPGLLNFNFNSKEIIIDPYSKNINTDNFNITLKGGI